MSANDKADAAWDDYVSQQQEEKIEQLERELNAATSEVERLRKTNLQLREGAEEQKQRIKRLEDAGVELRECASWVGHSCCQYADQILHAKAAIEAWDKEAKP